MDDLKLSLLILGLTSMGIVGIFVFTFSRGKKNRLALRKYCALHPYTWSERKERLLSAFVIHGRNWVLESGIETAENVSETGSSHVSLYTQWASTGPLKGAVPIYFGTINGADLPYLNAAMPLISPLFDMRGEEGLAAVVLPAPLDKKFMMMAPPYTPADVLGPACEKLLADWPQGWPLYAQIAADQILLYMKGKRLQKTEELDRLISLGEALARRFAARAEG